MPISMSNEELEPFLEGNWVAKLGTFNKDGTIHIAPIWYKYYGKYLLMNTGASTHKVRSIKRNPKVTLLVDSRDFPYKGAILYGNATLEPADREKQLEIFSRYLPQEKALQYIDYWKERAGPRVLIKFIPYKIVSWDHSKR